MFQFYCLFIEISKCLEIYFYHDQDGNEENKISEEMYYEISGNYHEIEGIPFYESIPENIEAMRTGSLQFL